MAPISALTLLPSPPASLSQSDGSPPSPSPADSFAVSISDEAVAILSVAQFNFVILQTVSFSNLSLLPRATFMMAYHPAQKTLLHLTPLGDYSLLPAAPRGLDPAVPHDAPERMASFLPQLPAGSQLLDVAPLCCAEAAPQSAPLQPLPHLFALLSKSAHSCALTFWKSSTEHLTQHLSSPASALLSLAASLPADSPLAPTAAVIVCQENALSLWTSVPPDLPESSGQLVSVSEITLPAAFLLASPFRDGEALLQLADGRLYRLRLQGLELDVSLACAAWSGSAASLIPAPIALTPQQSCVFLCKDRGDHEFLLLTADHCTPVSSLHNPAPLKDLHVTDAQNLGFPQLYSISGDASPGSFSLSVPGLGVSQHLSVQLPDFPRQMWASSLPCADHAPSANFFCVAFESYTMLLSLDADMIMPLPNAYSLKLDVTTILYHEIQSASPAGLLGLQVFPAGVRQIYPDGTFADWSPPSGEIQLGCANDSQLIVASGSILYLFQVASNESTPHKPFLTGLRFFDLLCQISCLDLPLSSSLASSFFVVGTLDRHIHILGTNSFEHTCPSISTLAAPCSVSIIPTPELQLSDSNSSAHLLTVGLLNGTLLRFLLHPLTGAIYPNSARVFRMGTASEPVYLTKMLLLHHDLHPFEPSPAVLSSTHSQACLSYSFHTRFIFSRIQYPSIQGLTPLISRPGEPQKFIGFRGKFFKLISLRQLAQSFYTAPIRLSFAPQQLLYHSQSTKFVISETRPASPASKHSPSLLHLVDPLNGVVIDVFEFSRREEVLHCVLSTVFNRETPRQQTIAVATRRRIQSQPLLSELVDDLPHRGGFLHLFGVNARDVPSSLSLLHSTAISYEPSCLGEFRGMLAVASPGSLRLYELSRTRFTPAVECEIPCLEPKFIFALRQDLLCIGDAKESFVFIHYHSCQLIVIAADHRPRSLTAAVALDQSTVAGADRFGNIFICRLEPINFRRLDDAFIPTLATSSQPVHRLREIAHFYVGEQVTALSVSRLSPGGPEAIVYSTLPGTIGMVAPLQTMPQVELLMKLQKLLTSVQSPFLLGHQRFHSAYFPSFHVFDGDLFETYFTNVDQHVRSSISKSLGISIPIVYAFLESMRPAMTSPFLN